jgi:hypothetical protein
MDVRIYLTNTEEISAFNTIAKRRKAEHYIAKG